MPEWDRDDFDQYYHGPARWGWDGSKWVSIGLQDFHVFARAKYHWCNEGRRQYSVADSIAPTLRELSARNIVIIGGGFGWTAERLRMAHDINCVVVETSEWVLDTYTTSEEGELREIMDVMPALVDEGYGPERNYFDTFPGFLINHKPLPVGKVWDMVLHDRAIPGSVGRTTVEIIGSRLATMGDRRKVLNAKAFDAPVDLILSEYALDSFDIADDPGRLLMCERMSELMPGKSCKIVHLVEPDANEQVLLAHTLDGWREWLDVNGFQDHQVMTSSGGLR